MKKIINLVFCLALVLGLTACDSKEEVAPTKVTSLFLNAYLNRDATQIKQYSDWNEDAIKVLQMQKDDYYPNIDKTLQDDVHKMMYGFDHKELKEDVKDDSATVTCELHVYNFAPVLKKGMKAAEKRVEELSEKSNISDALAQQEIITVLFKNIKLAKKDKKVTVTIHLKKNDDGQWIVTKDNTDLQDALLKNAKDIVDISE